MKWMFTFVVALLALSTTALAQNANENEEEVGKLIRRAALANVALEDARTAGNGSGMVDALSELLDAEQLLSRELRFVVRFVKLDDVREAASLAEGDVVLLQRIAEILPNSTRGASGGSRSDPVFVASDAAAEKTIRFKGNDIALVYIRNAHPGGLKLSVYPHGKTQSVCTSVVSRGWPVCAFTPDEDGDFQIRLESLNGQAQDVLLMVN
jgi:hypothetical protein